MLQGEHSAILLTFIKLPFVIKIFLLTVFEWLFYTGFTVCEWVEFQNRVFMCWENMVQCRPFITLFLGSKGMNYVISEPCNKKTIL